jgi:hypothetical protein
MCALHKQIKPIHAVVISADRNVKYETRGEGDGHLATRRHTARGLSVQLAP